MSKFIISKRTPVAAPETACLVVTVDILPLSTSSNYQEIYPQLLVDTVDVPITDFSRNDSDVTIGTSMNFTLHDYEQKNLITSTASIDFNYVDQGGTILKNIITDGRVASHSFGVRDDSFSFSVVSGAAAKLNICPTSNLVIYDPARTPFDATELEPTYDTDGNLYSTEAISTADLTLYDMLTEIFVTRCGFAGISTNILDFPIRRADFEEGVPFLEGVKPHIGMFEPQLIEKADGTLQINETTALLASGFPNVRDISIKDVDNYSVNAAITDAVYAELIYSEADTYDNVTFRPRAFVRPNGGSIVKGDLVTTQYQQVIAEFRNNYAPSLIQKEEISQQIVTTYEGIAVDSNKKRVENTKNYFDNYGRTFATIVTIGELVPDLDNEGQFIWKEESEVHNTDVEYGQHPFNTRRQFQKSISYRTAGLTVKDTDNPYAWNKTADQFDQGWREAHRTGNLVSGMVYVADKSLLAFVDNFTPDRSGLVTYNRSGFDNVQGLPLFNRTDPRAGDVGLGPTRVQKVKVGETPGVPIPQGIKITIAVGELPYSLAEPLARRRFKQIKDNNADLPVSVNGIDLSLERGTVFRVSDKDFNIEGTFLCIAIGSSGSVDQSTGATSYSMSLTGQQISSASYEGSGSLAFEGTDGSPVFSSYLEVDTAAAEIFDFQFDCLFNYEFTLDSPFVGADVEIKESAEGTWTDLEAGDYDMTAFAGQTKTFNVRVTPDSPRVITRDFLKICAQPI